MQIATVSSVRAFGLTVFPILYGYLADRLQMRKNFLVVATIGQVFPTLLMVYFHSYDWLLFLTCVFSIFNAPVLTLAEASTQEEHVILFACVMLMQVSHGTFYGFYSIYLSELGYSDSNIGLQWGIAACSELIVFFFASRILRSFPTYVLFSLCLFVAAIRWMLMFSTDSYFWLSLYQCLHAFTFGIFHVTTLRLIHKFFAEGSRSLGQSLYTTSSGGIGSALGLLLNGYLWDKQGHFAFLTSSGIALGAFACPSS